MSIPPPLLPTGLANAGDLSPVGQLSEADTANAVLSEIRVGTTADSASGIGSGRKLRGEIGFEVERGKEYEVIFEPEAFGSGQVIWNVGIVE